MYNFLRESENNRRDGGEHKRTGLLAAFDDDGMEVVPGKENEKGGTDGNGRKGQSKDSPGKKEQAAKIIFQRPQLDYAQHSDKYQQAIVQRPHHENYSILQASRQNTRCAGQSTRREIKYGLKVPDRIINYSIVSLRNFLI